MLAIKETTPNSVGQLTHQKDEMLSKGTWTSLRSGPLWTSWVSTRPRTRSCTWVGAIPAITTGWGMERSRAALPRRTWGYWWMKSWTQASNVRLQPRMPTISWAASRAAWPAGQGSGFCPCTLLWWDPTWSPASSSGALSTGKTWTCWVGPEEDVHKNEPEGWNTSPVRKGWESCDCSSWRREGSWKTFSQPSSTWRGPTRKLERDFLQGPVEVGWEVMALNWKRVDLD